jgi:hypothetical protein
MEMQMQCLQTYMYTMCVEVKLVIVNLICICSCVKNWNLLNEQTVLQKGATIEGSAFRCFKLQNTKMSKTLSILCRS